MKDYETGLTQEELQRILDYDPETGIFTWKSNRCNNAIKRGDTAGSKSYFSENSTGKTGGKICIRIKINDRAYLAHRLAWLYMTGEWPNIVDHDDRDPFNNKWDNLNNGTHQDNMKNRSIDKRNKSGVTGVRWYVQGSKWEAKIYENGKQIHLGYFKELHDAVAARRKAEKEYGFHPKHGRRSS